MVTCAGRSFVSRMTGSLLRGVGLEELITDTWQDYEALALALAKDRVRLETLRAKLRNSKSSCQLFDTDRTCRYLEAAYSSMWERAQQGLPPLGFAVQDPP